MKKRLLIFTIWLLSIPVSPLHGQDYVLIDSLLQALKVTPGTDTAYVDILNKISASYLGHHSDSSLIYSREALRLARQFNFRKQQAEALVNMAWAQEDKGLMNRAAENYVAVIQIREELKDRRGVAAALNNLAEIHAQQGNLVKALEYHLKALRIKESLNNKKLISSSLHNIGGLYRRQGKLDEALSYYQKALKITQQINDSQGTAGLLNDIGLVYQQKKQWEVALDYLVRSLEIDKKLKNKFGIALSMQYIGSLYSSKGENEVAMQYYTKALTMAEELQDKKSMASMLNKIGRLSGEAGHFDTALECGQKSMEISQEIGDRERAKEAMMLMAMAYAELGQYKKAYEYYVNYSELKDSLYNEEMMVTFNKLQANYELEKSQAQVQLLTKDKALKELDLKRQKGIRNTLLGILSLIVVLSFVLLNANRRKKKVNDLLTRQNLAIHQQKEEIFVQAQQLRRINTELELKNEENANAYQVIKNKNKQITDSIRYAQTIQHSILPSSKQMEQQLGEHFVIYRPKDIVSGDFYWCSQLHTREGTKTLVAVVDCTGHGVPGAFMSMVGYTLLNKIINENNILDPARVLEALNAEVRTVLKQEEKSNSDGMELCLCLLEEHGGHIKLSFAGARRSLYYISRQQFHTLAGSRKSIGGEQRRKEAFINQYVYLEKGSVLYLGTDGIADLHNPVREKFGSQRLRELLLKYQHLPMQQQGSILEQELENFQSYAEQRDDITLIGVRV